MQQEEGLCSIQYIKYAGCGVYLNILYVIQKAGNIISSHPSFPLQKREKLYKPPIQRIGQSMEGWSAKKKLYFHKKVQPSKQANLWLLRKTKVPANAQYGIWWPEPFFRRGFKYKLADIFFVFKSTAYKLCWHIALQGP